MILVVPALLLLLSVYALPLSGMFLASFGGAPWGLRQYQRILGDAFVLRTLADTIGVAFNVTIFCLCLGYPVAYLMLRSRPAVRRLIMILVIVPVWTSTLVRSYTWMVLLGRQGIINGGLQALGVVSGPLPLLYNRFSVYVGMVHIMLPFVILPLFGVMRRIDLNLVSAARSLGAGAFAAFWLVFFPLSLPGVAAGCVLVFILSEGFFVTPALLGGIRDITYVMLIERQVNELVNWELASAMAVVLLVVTVLLIIVSERIVGFGPALSGAGTRRGIDWLTRAPMAMSSATRRVLSAIEVGRRSRRVDVRPSKREWEDVAKRDDPTGLYLMKWLRLGGRVMNGIPVIAIVGWSVVLLVLAPIVLLFPLAFSASPFLEFPPRGVSLRWFRSYIERPDWIAATIVSLKVALLTTVVATVLGTLASVGVVRSRLRLMRLVSTFLISPLIVPTLVIAVAIYFQFARLQLVGTTLGLVLAHSVLAIPMVVVVVTGVLHTVDESLERAAMSLGAGPMKAFWKVTLPLVRPGVTTGAFFAFLASFDDVVMAIFLSGTSSKTLPKRMWEGIRFEIDPTIAAVSTLIIGGSLVLLAMAEIERIRTQRTRGPDEGPGR